MNRARASGAWPLDQTAKARALALIEWAVSKDWALMGGVVVGFVLRGVL